MKFILTNTSNYNKKLYGLDTEYFGKLLQLAIPYEIVKNTDYDCIIDIELYELLLLRDYTHELIITKDLTNKLKGNDIYPIIEIYDDWRE